MANKKQTEQQERERLAYLSFKHPADRTVEEQNEFEELRQKYG